MMTLSRTPAPTSELDRMRRVIDRMMDEPWFRPMSWLRDDTTTLPRMDVYSTEDAHLVDVALPGVKPEDVKVTLEGDRLTIRGHYQQEADRDESGYTLHELQAGEFCRSLTLTGAVKPDDISASFRDGMLKLRVPKAEESKPRQIEVKVSE
jgi:HSP20 family protein